MTITVHDPEKDAFFAISVTLQWAQRHDNGALISCGLTIGRDGFTRRMFDRLRPSQVRPITRDHYNHSGCQSYCTQRGDSKCMW